MGDLVIELIPSMLGLFLTPMAIAGGILLLGTPRPYANALAFMAGFLLAYSAIAALVVGFATASAEPLLSDRTRASVEVGVGGLLLLLALVLLAPRRRARGLDARRPAARRARKGLAARLAEATPPFAFGAGLVLAILNPNVPILVAGLAAVAAAGTGHVLGAVLLVVASISGILIPILWRLLAPRSAPRVLGRITEWIGAHDRTINLTILLVFGTAFVVKGLAG